MVMTFLEVLLSLIWFIQRECHLLDFFGGEFTVLTGIRFFVIDHELVRWTHDDKGSLRGVDQRLIGVEIACVRSATMPLTGLIAQVSFRGEPEGTRAYPHNWWINNQTTRLHRSRRC